MKNTGQFFVLLLFVFSPFFVFGQTLQYEKASRDVQLKMDENKREGKEMTNGISQSFVLKISTVTDAVSAQKTFDLVLNDFPGMKFQFVEAGKVKVQMPASFFLGSVKRAFYNKGIKLDDYSDHFYFVD